MGQAKQRGSFAQRQTESIQREAERQERERAEHAARKEQQRLHDLTHPKQAAARRARSRRTSAMLSVVLAASLMGTLSTKGGSDV